SSFAPLPRSGSGCASSPTGSRSSRRAASGTASSPPTWACTRRGRSVADEVRIGIDTHAAERATGGNSTYIRGLVRALAALAGDETYLLSALEPRHPFYADLPANPRVQVRRLWPRTPVLRIPFALAAASVRDRLDVLHVQYVGPRWHRGAC